MDQQHDITVASQAFDRIYQLPITPWGDIRVPAELKALARQGSPGTVLELGCGLGRFSRYMASNGLQATGVDFSRVAIAKAKQRVAKDLVRPAFMVANVTQLEALTEPFDISFDVGCFHCLGTEAQPAYVSEVQRLTKPGGTLLIWAMDRAPADIDLSPKSLQGVFEPKFQLFQSRESRRRIVRSHWYWFVRQ